MSLIELGYKLNKLLIKLMPHPYSEGIDQSTKLISNSLPLNLQAL